jgi:hypothetical protein
MAISSEANESAATTREDVIAGEAKRRDKETH